MLDSEQRYEDLGPIATGGMGEVRRVRDRRMDRILAMKILRAELARYPIYRAEFQHEGSVTARLQHPGIVPVHDQGRLEDGRPWFTMKEVRGHTFRVEIERLHSNTLLHDGAVQLRQAVEVLLRACEAVGYAHGEGVVHRDIKPDNLMVGDWGEVLVMDWGLAWLAGTTAPNGGKRIARSALPTIEEEDSGNATLAHQPTLHLGSSAEETGGLVGTLAYMAPEQARGEQPAPSADVYALGAVLYELMAGRRAYVGTTEEIWLSLFGEDPPPLHGMPPSPLRPPELGAICAKAMQRELAQRYRDAGALAAALRSWLDGTERRRRAQQAVDEADALLPETESLRVRARKHNEEARAVLDATRPFDPVASKAPGWRQEARAQALLQEIEILEVRRMQKLRSALEFAADYVPAHTRLADYYQREVERAERTRDQRAVTRNEILLQAHAQPAHQAFIRGDGALTLVTHPAGADVSLHRFEERDRALVAVPAGELGRTPLRQAPLKQGSYLLKIRYEGRAEVRYPILIERAVHWQGIRPGDEQPHPIELPYATQLADDDIYVPAGWFLAGGDPTAIDSLPAMRLWLDAFVIKRDPVTTRQYLTYLNALVEAGQEKEALTRAPRVPHGLRGAAQESSAFSRDKHGLFYLRGDESPPEHLDWPVVRINWHDAIAYADWLSAETGLPWRLPNELEWEKAARGVDGRKLPWGDHPEPTRTYVLESREEVLWRIPVQDMVDDVSVYGMRGSAGNVSDWCATPWTWKGWNCLDNLVQATTSETTLNIPRNTLLVTRGTTWTNPIAQCRSASRFADRPTQRRGELGIRLALSL